MTNDLLPLFLYYCERGEKEKADLIVEDVAQDDQTLAAFTLAASTVTRMAVKKKVTPHSYLLVYRVGYRRQKLSS